MKKIFLLFFSLLSFAACSVEVPLRDDPPITSIEGTLLASNDANGDQSIVLVDSDGKEVSLSSLAIDLSKDDYLGNLVDLTGFYKENDTVFEVTGIAVLDVNNDEQQGEFTKLKSTQNGFEISYYDNWNVREVEKEVDFGFVNEGVKLAEFGVTISSFDYINPDDGGENSVEDTTLVAKNALTDFFVKTNVDVKVYEERTVGSDNYFAFFTENEGDQTYYLYRNGFVYRIQFDALNAQGANLENKLLDLKNEFLTSLATFKFLPFANTEVQVDGDLAESDSSTQSFIAYEGEMTPFESLPYSFMGMYPKDWYYAGSRSNELGVLHHYGFSDETVESGNEKIALDVLSTPLPKGEVIHYNGKDFVMIRDGGVVEYYFTFEGKTFRFRGEVALDSLVLAIAGSIEKLDLPDVD